MDCRRPQFSGVRETAANISRARGSYTADIFQEDFPQFYTAASGEEPAASLVPPAMLSEFIRQANGAITPDKWLDGGMPPDYMWPTRPRCTCVPTPLALRTGPTPPPRELWWGW